MVVISWDNLLSGFIGALVLFVLQILYQKYIDSRAKKNKINNLYNILINDLSSIIIHLYSSKENEQKVSQSLISNRIWRDLTPNIIELLPANLVAAITYIYLSFEILNDSQNPNLKEQFKPAIKYNLEGLFNTMKANEPSMNKYSEIMKNF